MVFLLLWETLTFFGSLGGEIDTIGNLGGHWQWDGCWGGYVYFSHILCFQNKKNIYIF
jgi:hypothetical protein